MAGRLSEHKDFFNRSRDMADFDATAREKPTEGEVIGLALS